MSQRNEKGAAAPKTSEKIPTKTALQSLRTRPEELPEITHDCWQDWDEILMTLKEYFRKNFQDLESICPDPMLLTELPAYVNYPLPALSETEMAQLTPENDPSGLRKQTMMLIFRALLTACTQKKDKQLLERGSAYRVIRSMCSPQLNAILVVDPRFILVNKADPLELLAVIKSVVTSRSDGNVALDRDQALRDWYCLTMNPGEDIIAYGRRAVKKYERLVNSGVAEAMLPTPKAQSLRFIDGLSSAVVTYNDYKNYISNALSVSKVDVAPKTLVDAINCVTKFHRGEKVTATSATSHINQTSLQAIEEAKPPPKNKGKKDPKKSRDKKAKPGSENKPGTDKGNDSKTKAKCFNCGKIGHFAVDCRSKKKDSSSPPPAHTASVRVSAAAMEHDSRVDYKDTFYTTFGEMHDKVDDGANRQCRMNHFSVLNLETPTLGPVFSFPVDRSSTSTQTTEAIFDTGATGTIITNEAVLTNIASCNPTVFRGLHGSLTVTRAGQLSDIGIVHFDPRAGLSIISASDCLLQGHQWEFKQGHLLQLDAFLLHTKKHTYRFQYRKGLYVADLATPPEPRYDDAPMPREAVAHPTIVVTPKATMLYTSKLQTTSANEAGYSRREVQRSIEARKFQASLGFPPDVRLISALQAGTFLNCDILPADVKRATAIWGVSVAALKGRTTTQRPMPPPQEPVSRRSFDQQHMHCDLMFINKQPYLVSITHPLGVVLVASVENVSTSVLRQSLRRMFGTYGSRHISIAKFTSDNERGITALFGDMNAMGVEVITVGPGQHDHIIERMIRTLKEIIRATIFSLPYLLPDNLMPHLVMSSAKKLLLFASYSTRSDGISPFEAFFGRKADTKRDIGPPFGSYCQVSSRVMTNSMEARTAGCLYLEARMNGTNTHTFMRLDTRSIISANHFRVLPIPDVVVTLVNSWASKNKTHIGQEPTFTFHERDITAEPAEDEVHMEPMTTTVPRESPPEQLPTPLVLPFIPDSIDSVDESPRAPNTSEIRGEMEPRTVTWDLDTPSDEISGQNELPDGTQDPNPEDHPAIPANVRTNKPSRPLETRELSTRIRKPPVKLNLEAIKEPTETLVDGGKTLTALMSVSRGLKLFKEKTTLAIEAEVKSLLLKKTFSGVHMDSWPSEQKKRILRSIMNVVEKYHPTVDANGDRQVDKVKARLCVDGRAQLRDNYRPEEIESPTASISSIFAIAQIAAAQDRFVMIGDVGSAYLNADMPMDNPAKILYMSIEPDVANEIVKQDNSFAVFQRKNGSIVVRLNKALYGCIESAKLWYKEIAGTLNRNGFTANPRDICIFNKEVGKVQITIAVYVDDLMMTSVNKDLVLKMEKILLDTYGQFRTTQDCIVSYLGCTWDFSEKHFVKVSQAGMIQDLVTSREKTHTGRGTTLTGKPLSPGAPYLFDRTPDCALLSDVDAKIFHTDVATALYLANRTKPTITLAVGELCKRVKAPTREDDQKLDRLICYLRATRDVPLRLGCIMPPKVTVSIDAAFANRENMKST